MNFQRNEIRAARLPALLTVALFLALASVLSIPQPAEVAAQDAGPTPTYTPFPWAPTPVPLVPRGEDDIVNILLLGTDVRNPLDSFRTDTNIILSANRTAQTVSLLSIPRDTYIWIPGWNWGRINTVYWRGDYDNWPGGGPALAAYTIAYNFGVEIDFYALVDFTGFRTIIDTLGGVTIPVDCPVSGFKLRSPELDEADEANYDFTYIPIGVHHMDGDLALWYARSRAGTNDWERNRRQQQILRAIWQQARQTDALLRLPELWNELMEVVTTDLQLLDAVGFVPLALALDANRIESHFLGPDQLRFSSTREGASILVARDYESVRSTIENLYSPPTQNVLVQDPPRIEILNGTPNEGWEMVAAARLTWEGLLPLAGGAAASDDFPHTVIYDYTGRTKGSALTALKRVLNVRDDNIIEAPDPERTVDYRVILGASYNACTFDPGVPVPGEREWR